MKLLFSFVSLLLIAVALGSPLTKDNQTPEARLARKDLFQGDIAGVEPWTRNVITDMSLRWPNGVVPYVIQAGDFSAADERVIQNAIDNYAADTCVRFVPRNGEADYIHIFAESGCWSYIGRLGGRQDISLQNPGCVYLGTIQHEFMHALGVWHEQSRSDRDGYVEIQWSNIQAGYASNFAVLSTSESQTFGLAYDYDSLMHYGAYDFAQNPLQPTIITIPPGIPIGQRNGFSNIDRQKINTLYEC